MATTKGGVVARKEIQVECTVAGDPPANLPSPPEAKSCGECAADVTSRICVNSEYIKLNPADYNTGACCPQGDQSEKCTESETNKCSPMLLTSQSAFYAFCPMNSEEKCGGKSFSAEKDVKPFSFAGMSKVDDKGRPKNDACTYDVAAPDFKSGSMFFRLTKIRNMKAYLRFGSDAKSAKSLAAKNRRRLEDAMDDAPMVEGKDYPLDMSKGKLMMIVIPDDGTKPADTSLEFKYWIKGVPKTPEPPAAEPKEPKPEPVVTAVKEEGDGAGGINTILLIIVCFLVGVIVACACMWI